MFVLDTYANTHNRVLNHLLMCLSALDAVLTVFAASTLTVKSLMVTSCELQLLQGWLTSITVGQVRSRRYVKKACSIHAPRLIHPVTVDLASAAAPKHSVTITGGLPLLLPLLCSCMYASCTCRMLAHEPGSV